MYRLALIVTAVCLFGTVAAAADYYRYVDQDGVVRFTDDASQIPDQERDRAQKYKEIPQAPAASDDGDAATEAVLDASDSSQPVAGKEQTPKAPPPVDLEQMRAELEKEKKSLDANYQVLSKDLQDLEKDKAAAKTKRLIKAYNERVAALNQRINKYEKDRQMLNKKIGDFNTAVGGEAKKTQ